jgi:hypothetical protein
VERQATLAGDDARGGARRVNGTAPPDLLGRRWCLTYAGSLVAVFVPLYVLTRPLLLISDGAAWVREATLADPSRTWYGFPTYFLQIPLAAWSWRVLHALGLPVTVEGVHLGVSLAGTLTAIIFVGLIAATLLRSREAAWLAAILFGASLNPWTQWNGELSGLAVGFTAAGLFFALHDRLARAVAFWALSVLSQINFIYATPVFVLAAWMAGPDGRPAGTTLRRAAGLPVVAGTATLLLFLIGSRAVGKWHDLPGLVVWLSASFATVERSVLKTPDVARAVKGLLTAYTAAGHSLLNVIARPEAFESPGFVPALVIGSVLVAVSVAFVLAASRVRRLVLFALVWLVPFEALFNWWWAPAEEEYHTGALPGLVLLVAAGLWHCARRLPARRRYALYGGYVAVFAGLNLFTAILPRQALAADSLEAGEDIRRLMEARSDRAVLVTCDGGNVTAVRNAGIEYLRIRSIWKGSVPEIQQAIRAWVDARRAEGKEPYMLGRWCYPKYWKTAWSKEPFDLYFLERDFRLIPAGITAVPTDQFSVTDPFTWGRGDVVRLDPITAAPVSLSR